MLITTFECLETAMQWRMGGGGGYEEGKLKVGAVVVHAEDLNTQVHVRGRGLQQKACGQHLAFTTGLATARRPRLLRVRHLPLRLPLLVPRLLAALAGSSASRVNGGAFSGRVWYGGCQ